MLVRSTEHVKQNSSGHLQHKRNKLLFSIRVVTIGIIYAELITKAQDVEFRLV